MSTVIGDSNVSGFGNVTPWPDLLGYDNYGQPGSRLGDWARNAHWLPSEISGSLYVQIGSNDVGLPISQNWSNWVSTLAQRGLDAGAEQVILLFPPPRVMRSVSAQATVDARLVQIDQAMSDACFRAPAVVKCESYLKDLPVELLKADGLHFTQAAHHYVADVVALDAVYVPEPPQTLLVVVALLCVAVLWWLQAR